MPTCSSQHHRSDAIFAVLDIVAGHIQSQYTQSQLSAASRHCRAISATYATLQLQALLLPVLRQVAAQPEGPLQQQHMNSIKWLCSTASKEAFASATDAVLAVANVPAAAAQMLVAAGVRVDDNRVTAAALRQEPGAEVWVQARVAVHGPTASVGRSDAELRAGR
jgi:hypothetical protein